MFTIEQINDVHTRLVFSLAPVGLEHAQAVFGEHVCPLAGVNLNGVDQPLIPLTGGLLVRIQPEEPLPYS